MMLISNCEPKSPRNQYLAELIKYIDIDSYGQCFHNKVRTARACVREWCVRVRALTACGRTYQRNWTACRGGRASGT
jgi:hypothetical protein